MEFGREEKIIILFTLILINASLLFLFEYEKTFVIAEFLFLLSWINIFIGSFGFAYGVKLKKDTLVLLLSIFLIIQAIIIDIRILFTLENFNHIFTISNLVSEVVMAFTIPRLLLEEERYDLDRARFEWEKKRFEWEKDWERKKLIIQFIPQEEKKAWFKKRRDKIEKLLDETFGLKS